MNCIAPRYNADLGSLDGAYLYIESPTHISEISVVRTGGSNLLAANQLPELPDEVSPPQSTYIPLVMR